MDSIRVSELAKELGMTSKEVIEKFREIDIIVKSHSNTVNPTQIKKLKEHLGIAPKKSNTKPKAFVVKKTKPAPVEDASKDATASKEEKPAVSKIEKVERIERVQRVPKIEKVERIERVERVEKPAAQEKKPLVEKIEKKVEKPAVRIERTRIEYPKNQSRIEIVRRAPQKPVKSADDKNKRPAGKGPQEKKLVERRIIPQEIYEGKSNSAGKRKVDAGKKKDKDFNSKKEDQEMISLEKAAAQKHKKKSHKEEEQAEVKQIVVNQPMTISELADKIHKTPAEIVKFLMFQGIMATVNQLIDVDTIKKVCAEYELEVLEEDIEAFME